MQKKRVKAVSKKEVKQAVAKTKAAMANNEAGAPPPPRELSEFDCADLGNRADDMTRAIALLDTVGFLLDFACQDAHIYEQLRPGKDVQASIREAVSTVRRMRRETRKMIKVQCTASTSGRRPLRCISFTL